MIKNFAIVALFIIYSLNVYANRLKICDELSLNQISQGDFSKIIPYNRCLSSMVCSKSDRVKVACDLSEAIMEKYSLFYLKKELINLDGEEHLTSCIQGEIDIEDNNNIHFIERMKTCVAAFKDTHFKVRAQIPMPWIYTGIRLKEIDNKFYISAIYPKMIRFIKKRNDIENVEDILKIGNEIVLVDGKKPQEARDQYKPYIAGSNEAYINLHATKNITERNYKYPEKNYIELKIKVANYNETEKTKEVRFRLPWWTQDRVRFDLAKKFQEIGIQSLDIIKYKYQSNKWVIYNNPVNGYKDSKPLIDESLLETFNDDDDDPALRIGQITKKQGKTYCYMQLLTFSTDKLFPKEKKGKKFIEPIRDFIKSCKEKELPLIFDLRSNGGGYGSYPAKILSVLTEKDKSYSGRFSAFRTNKHTAWYLTYGNDHEVYARNMSDFSDFRYFIDEFFDAYKKGDRYTSIITGNNVFADKKVKGYSEKIITLITPRCVSACDNMANLLKKSKRSTLIGTHTNGTGAGFRSWSSIDSIWKDSHSVLKTKIPNYLFGVKDHYSEEDGDHFLEFDKNKHLISENKPIKADIKYQTTLDDIKSFDKSCDSDKDDEESKDENSKDKGWLNIALKHLF